MAHNMEKAPRASNLAKRGIPGGSHTNFSSNFCATPRIPKYWILFQGETGKISEYNMLGMDLSSNNRVKS